MTFLNLPNLDNIKFSTPAARGIWAAVGLNLDSLADSLAIPTDVGQRAELKSVPDAWAQLLTFAEAFEQQTHPRHNITITQWRALLALVALAPASSEVYELEIRQLSLDSETAEPATRSFNAVLRHLLPLVKLDPDVCDWNRPALVCIRKPLQLIGGGGEATPIQVVGVLSPATLVAAGKNGDELRLPDVPWLAKGFTDPTSSAISDPNNVSGLNDEHYAILVQYLDALLSTLRNLQRDGAQRGLLLAVIDQLSKFREECSQLAGPANHEFEPVELASGLPRPYDALVKTVKLADGPRRVSDCVLQLRSPPQNDRDLKGIILVDESLPATLGSSPHAIMVWSGRRLSQALQLPVYEIIRAEAQRAGYLVVRPSDFFTDELVQFEDGAEVVGHSGADFRNLILPFSPLVLLLLSPSQINDSISLRRSGANTYRISLKLPFANGREHTIERVFSADVNATGPKFTSKQSIPLSLGLWPDFQSRDWNWNFLRVAYDPRDTMSTRFGTSGAHLLWVLNSDAARREIVFNQLVDGAQCKFVLDPEDRSQPPRERVTPIDSPDPVQRLRSIWNETSRVELQWSKLPYEAICFARRRSPDDKLKPAGMVLLPNNPAPSVIGGASVSLDFGTSNTIAYVKGPNDGDDPSIITFRDRVIFPVIRPQHNAQDRDDQKWVFMDFLPISPNRMPIPTVSKVPPIEADPHYPALEQVQRGNDDRLLFSSVSFFLPAPSTSSDRRRTSDAENLVRQKDALRFNLKWAKGYRDLAKRYLRQLMVMIGAELIHSKYNPRQTQWYFSYPEALPDPEQFTQMFRAQLAYAFGERISAQDYTEAGAAAAYFQASKQNPGQISLILDVGGGTTDVALWTKSLLWRASFRIAGGDFFTNYVYNNPDLLGEGLLLPDLASIVAARPKPPRGLLELLFYDRRFAPALRSRYDVIAQEQAAGLRQCALIALGGILFYIGRVSAQLASQMEIEPELFDGMTIALAGRGSQVFSLFMPAASGRTSRLERTLAVFSAGAGLDPSKYRPELRMSDEPKCEVAAGMLLKRFAEEEPLSKNVPLGETVKIRRDGATQVLSPETSLDQLVGTELNGVSSLTSFDQFLAAMKDTSKLAINLTEAGRRKVLNEMTSRMNTALSNAKRIKEAEARRETTANLDAPEFEPPFISALRALVELAALPEDERNRMVEIREGG